MCAGRGACAAPPTAERAGLTDRSAAAEPAPQPARAAHQQRGHGQRRIRGQDAAALAVAVAVALALAFSRPTGEPPLTASLTLTLGVELVLSLLVRSVVALVGWRPAAAQKIALALAQGRSLARA